MLPPPPATLTRIAAAALLLSAAGCASLPPRDSSTPAGGTGTVRARLVAGAEAVPGATIRALRNIGSKFQEQLVEKAAGGDGEALLRLPAGSYYLTARSADGTVFGYYGPNPIEVRAGEEVTAAVRGLRGNIPPEVRALDGGMSSVAGVVTGEDGPLPGGVVAFYLDGTSAFRGPAYLEVETGGDGAFSTSISPGRYFVVVRRRSGGEGRRKFGPLAIGDHFGYYAFNPLYVAEGTETGIQVGAVEVLRRSGWSASSSSRTRLSGTVRERRGSPLEGYRVFLHDRPDMLGKPAFVSEPTGPDGRYEIWVEKAGTFYLGARGEIGVARSAGESVGHYEGREDHSVAVTMDGEEMTGYDLVVDERRGP